MLSKRHVSVFALLLIVIVATIPALTKAAETYTYVSVLKAYPQTYSNVRGVAVDSSGNIFVVDSDADKVLKFSSDYTPIPITFEGSFNFNFLPGNIVFDSQGYIYISDENSVRKFSSTGSLRATLGTWTAVSDYPGGIAVDSQFNVYATAPTQGKVYKFSPNQAGGYDTTSFSGTSEHPFSGPMRIAVHDNLVYVAQASSNELFVFNPSGGYVASFFMNGIADSIATDSDGNIYADYLGLSYVEKFSPSGVASTTFGRWQILSSYGVAVDSAGYVYVSDNGNTRIIKFNQAGTAVAIYNGFCNFEGAYTVAVDSTGNIFLADFIDNKILKFTNTYIQIPISFGDATFSFLHTQGGIALDSSGNIYVSDDSGVRKFLSTGALLTTLGTWSSDNFPGGIAVDSSYVYVTAPGQGKIFKFTLDGAGVTSFSGTEQHPLVNPIGIAVHGDRVYVNQGFYNSPILVFSTIGAYLTSLSISGISDSIATDGSGNVYVTYPLLGLAEKLSSSGDPVASIGEQGSGTGQFANPHGVSVDSNGYVYVADGGRIQKFSPPPPEPPESQPLVVLSLAEGPYGSDFKITCSGFVPYTDVTITLPWGYAPRTYKTDENGVADRLSVVVPTEVDLGPYAITATGTTQTGSASATAYFTVTPLNSLVFDDIGSPQTVGAPFNIKITATDYQGNVLTSFTGIVTLSCSNGAVISPTLTGRFVDGVWIGNVQINSAATEVTINAIAPSGATGSSNSFAVAPGMVVPEYPAGALAVIVASLCAFAVFKKHRAR